MNTSIALRAGARARYSTVRVDNMAALLPLIFAAAVAAAIAADAFMPTARTGIASPSSPGATEFTGRPAVNAVPASSARPEGRGASRPRPFVRISSPATTVRTQSLILASPLPIQIGDTWRYFKGTSAPPASWNTLAFDDSSWSQGPGGFGYGPDCTSDRGTVLTDMENPPSSPGYVTLYTRRLFSVPNPGAIGGLELTVDYDDGFVAYINGVEVARSSSVGGTAGTPVSNTASPTSRECSACDGTCNDAQTFSIGAGVLQAGDNVLAIDGHNRSLDSSDFTLIASLRAVEPPNPPPSASSLPDSPPNGGAGVPTNPTLCVTVDDPDNEPLNVTFFGRLAAGASGEDFTAIALPDTQFYAQNYPQIFNAQTQWIRDSQVSRNIVFVTELGDCTNDGDTAGQEYQWSNADSAFSILENATSAALPDGIPYGIAIGNHDNTSNARSGADEGGSTVQYTKVFGLQRSCPGVCSNNSSRACRKDSECTGTGICNPGSTCRGYFGGRYDFGSPTTYFRNTDNHYELFSAGGMDFIIFHLEWDNPTDASPANSPVRTAVLNWMHALLAGPYRSRRAIITAHYFLDASGSFSGQGQHTYNVVKDLPNVFLMLCGHRDQAVDRADPADDGHTIYTLMSDYQTRPNGGDGWLRILSFSPQNNSIHVETWSPFIEGGRFINKPTRHADDLPTNAGGNELTLSYSMDAGSPFESLGTVTNVRRGEQVCLPWNGLPAGTSHEWYVLVNDGHTTVRSNTWSFTTSQTCASDLDCDDHSVCNGSETCQAGHCAGGQPLVCNDDNPCTDDGCDPAGGCVYTEDDTNACGDGDACNGFEYCVAGTCTNNTPPVCDDQNPCTDDTCAAATGCVHTNNSFACSDGSACTTGDVCTGGSCRGTYAPFAGCCAVDVDCNDGNRSTADACSSGSCSNTPNLNCQQADECDDGDPCSTDACSTDNIAALDFDGTDDFVTMGAAPGLNASPRFTVETWFKWDGGGSTTGTGSGGITAIPLVAKGRADTDSVANRNLNYFLGIFLSSGNGRLAADFEDSTGGLNHPVCAALTTPAISVGDWHHAAAVYDFDGATGTWHLFLDGVELSTDTSCSSCSGAACTTTPSGAVPEPASIQPFSLGSAIINPSGTETPAGYFDGRLDEVRVWRTARTATQIQNGMGLQIDSDANLLGRWGLNSTSGSTAVDSDPNGDAVFYNGTLKPGSPSTNVPLWVTGGANLPPLGNGTCSHTPLDCDDGDSCTTDYCAGGICGHTPSANGTACNDGSACTTADACSGGVCRGTFAPTAGCCSSNAQCDDRSASTTDTCVSHNCVNALTPCNVNSDCNDNRPCTTDTCSGGNPFSLDFDGTNDYVSMGAAARLNTSPKFTVETWFLWDGGGATTSTGTGGITAIPLVTKGRAQAETPANLNTNYFLGIYLTGGVGRLTADFEDSVSGLNHPVCEAATGPAISTGVWHHAAAVYDYDGTLARGTWSLDLDGTAVAIDTACSTCTGAACTTTPSAVPEPNSIQRFALGSALTSITPEQPAGFFDGKLDEVRVWRTARTLAQIQAGLNQQITSNPDLLGRWGLNEGPSGASALDSDPNADGTSYPGTLLPAANPPVWFAIGGPVTGACSRAAVAGCCASNAECVDTDRCTADTCVGNNSSALRFDGVDDYVSMGAAAGLNVSPNFTVETWFNWDGDGTATSTGAGGITAIPLVTKGRAEVETPANLNMNYFFGISLNNGNGRLAADFEDAATGLNHPVCMQLSAPAISLNVWHHAAAVFNYNSSTSTGSWQLILDGVNQPIDTACSTCTGAACTTTPAAFPEPNSIQRFALGSALQSAVPEIPAGYFGGRLDEVRVWRVARTLSQIQAGRNIQIQSDANLVGRWSLNQGAGGTVPDSDPNGDGTFFNGTLLPSFPGNAPTWEPDGSNLPEIATGTCGHASNGVCCTSDAECADSNACTTDTCVNGTCTHPNNFQPCDDGNACTTNDRCEAGSCRGGAALNCSDGNPCTDDVCSQASGCSHPNNTVSCEDGNLCTTGDRCNGGICRTGTAADCDDDEPCTSDSCSPATGCGHVVLTGACNDGNACTSNDTCSGGVCRGGPAPNCDDSNPCTTDACSTATGCTHVNNAIACDDGSACTTNDACSGGTCRGGPAPNCDDGNSCTDDVCSPVLGCRHTNNTAPCNDGSICTTGDACSDGLCVSGPATNCDDGNACTTDSCNPTSGCSHANNTNPCNDANACTTNDACSAGACRGGTALNCDDANPCTTDSCNPATGCAHANNTTACSDGNACTSNDACSGGVCRPGTTLNCDDGNVCTTDSCDTASGCVHANNTLACNDNNSCTSNDVCAGGVCAGTGTCTTATILERRVAAGSDDAEEKASGSMSLTSSDLELIHDSDDQKVGLRFANITIPRSAAISAAWIQFKSDELQSEATNLTIQAQAISNAPTFTTARSDVSSRARTGRSVAWAPVPWTATSEVGPNEKTPDIAALIQDVVNGTGWASGNALVLCIQGTGHRTAKAFEGDAAGAPLLHIEYAGTGGGGNQPPNGTIDTPTGNVAIQPGGSVSFTGTGLDPDNNTPLRFAWNMGGGATNRTVEDPGSVTFATAGTYTITFTVTDSLGLSDPTPATRVITVSGNQPPNGTIDTPTGNVAIQPGGSVSFTGTGSDPDNNTPLRFAWNMGGGATNRTVEDPGSVAFATAGTYTITFTVTDSLGLPDPTPATRVITVSANQAPNGTISTPSSDTAITAGQSVSFSGTGSDPDNNTPLSFSWNFGGGAANSTAQNPGSVAFATAGTYTVTLTVRDSLGLADPTPASRVITVNPAGGGGGTNLVGNPSFESDTSRWSAYGSDTIARVSGGQDGAFCLEMRGGSSTTEFGINDSANWVGSTGAAGTRYRFTAYVKLGSGSGRARIRVREYASSGQVGLTTYSTVLTLTAAWQPLTVDYVSQQAGSSLDMQILDAPAAAGAVFQTDNISIRTVP